MDQKYPNLHVPEGVNPHSQQPPPSYDSATHTGSAHVPNPSQPPTVVHVYHAPPQVGPEPVALACPSCRHQITTRLEFETSTKTHIMAGLLCAFICWPCAWIPYVMDSCKNGNHYCPNCGSFIGTYSM